MVPVTCDIGVCTFNVEMKDARDLRRASLRTRRALALACLYYLWKNSVLCRRYLPKARQRTVTACLHSSDHQGTGRRLVKPVVWGIESSPARWSIDEKYSTALFMSRNSSTSQSTMASCLKSPQSARSSRMWGTRGKGRTSGEDKISCDAPCEVK